MNLHSWEVNYWISKWLKGGGGGGKCKFRNRKREYLKYEREEDQKLDDWEERKEGKSKGNVGHSGLPPLCFQSYALACLQQFAPPTHVFFLFSFFNLFIYLFIFCKFQIKLRECLKFNNLISIKFYPCV